MSKNSAKANYTQFMNWRLTFLGKVQAEKLEGRQVKYGRTSRK